MVVSLLKVKKKKFHNFFNFIYKTRIFLKLFIMMVTAIELCMIWLQVLSFRINLLLSTRNNELMTKYFLVKCFIYILIGYFKSILVLNIPICYVLFVFFLSFESLCYNI